MRVWLSLLLLLYLTGCATLNPDAPKPVSHVLPADPASPLAARALAGIAAAGGQGSAFRLLESGGAALAARLALIEGARHSLDVQYYIFRADTSGKLLVDALLRAAGRGVRVRLLLDDMYGGENEAAIIGLDAHENVEIRLFNPFHMRGDVPLGRALEYLAEGSRGRRMHNKLFLADGHFGITGGRNIGDEYFQLDASLAFQDLDVLAAGPVVAELGAAFDRYWNAGPAYPARGLPKPAPRGQLMREVRAEAEAVRDDAGARLAAVTAADALGPAPGSGWGPWSGAAYELLVDDPDKVTGALEGAVLPVDRLMRRGLETQRELLIVSPYFVPGDKGVDYLAELRRRGVAVRVLTNSLAANDVAVVHAGYARYRRPLLRAGVELYELKPWKTRPLLKSLRGGASRASLHGKAVVFDRQAVYIGSMNLDPRSVALNTEAGLLLRDTDLARQVARLAEQGMAPEYSYAVSLDTASDALTWRETQAGTPVSHASEPRAGLLLRGLIKLLSWLPIEEAL